MRGVVVEEREEVVGVSIEERGGAAVTACGERERGGGCGEERESCGHGCLWKEREGQWLLRRERELWRR